MFIQASDIVASERTIRNSTRLRVVITALSIAVSPAPMSFPFRAQI
jgi:hypothetical protein